MLGDLVKKLICILIFMLFERSLERIMKRRALVCRSNWSQRDDEYKCDPKVLKGSFKA